MKIQNVLERFFEVCLIMKACVITLHNINNYGSVMQTYATQHLLESLGLEVEIIDYWRPNTVPEVRAQNLLNSRTMRKLKPIWGISPITEKATLSFLKSHFADKESVMWKFLKKHVTLSQKRYYSIDELKQEDFHAEIYITGSDQVWNSKWNGGIDRVFFLEFAPEKAKRIAFSSSIGRTSFDEEEIAETKELLQKYNAISVREQSAVDLLKTIGIDATLVPDPTLMLTAEEWKSIEHYDYQFDRPYLLIYQLHGNNRMDGYAAELAKRNSWDIVRIGQSRSDRKRIGKCLLGISVEQFLGLFSHAACVLTDSFHATAFSLNFGVNFVDVLPDEFGTRIESITALTGTQNRILRDYADYSIANNPIDIEHVKAVLDEQRKTGMEFLKRSIG